MKVVLLPASNMTLMGTSSPSAFMASRRITPKAMVPDVVLAECEVPVLSGSPRSVWIRGWWNVLHPSLPHSLLELQLLQNFSKFLMPIGATSAPTRINSRQKSQFELNCFFENEIRVEYELIQIAKNSIRIHSNGIRIDSNEITKNSKNSFF
jgi:hypothetical protein